MELIHSEHGAYELEVQDDSVAVRFDTGDRDYMDYRVFPLNPETRTVAVGRDTRQRYIDVLESNGFEVGYNGYF